MSKFYKVENTSDLLPSGGQDATATNVVMDTTSVSMNISDLPPSGGQDATATNVVMDTTSVSISECKGYVVVVDNVDKNFRPSHQREDRQTKSLHITHSYVVKNRVDISMLSDEPPFSNFIT